MKKTIKGQITIFMALIFMVIFTMFTMTVSLSMFIHDKINLQNATDLASYYAASKQAELLGAIAHNNYAIRQSFKLLSYRYRVYGNGGRTDSTSSDGLPLQHPGIQTGWDSYYNDNTTRYVAASDRPSYPPRVCAASPHLFSDIVQGSTDNPCRKLDFSVGYVSPVTSIVGSLVGGVNSGVIAANALVLNSCQSIAYFNWWYSNMIIASHRLEQRDRRVIIEELAINLSREIIEGDSGMLDIEGGNVYAGAYSTFLYNLTEANREELRVRPRPRSQVLTITNSMQGRSPDDWLSPIYMNLLIPYSHYETAGSGCAEQLFNQVNGTPVTNNLSAPGVAALKQKLDPEDAVATYGNSAASFPSEPFYWTTIGVEKNPWYMVYNKTESRIFSRPLFLGAYVNPDGLDMRALSYAKPFGGRIGPWYRRVWPNGSTESATGDRTDERSPSRVTPADYATNVNVNDPTIYPNYSRFPTDQFGLQTNQAMVHAGPLVGWSFGSVGAAFRPPTSTQDYAKAVYSYLTSEYSDPLAQDVDSPQPTNSFNRRLEIAAIMPDAFDFTYYSISPNYYDYFIDSPDPSGGPRLAGWLNARLPTDIQLRGDIGSHSGNLRFSIMDQMFINDEVQAIDQPAARDGFTVRRNREPIPYFFTDNPLALLTGWNKGENPMDYLPPTDGGMDDFFATCAAAFRGNASLDAKPRVPAGCLRGGRFGYSVKLISTDYINDEHPIGGDGTSGAILNPL